eukprot:gene16461-biopygen5264
MGRSVFARVRGSLPPGQNASDKAPVLCATWAKNKQFGDPTPTGESLHDRPQVPLLHQGRARIHPVHRVFGEQSHHQNIPAVAGAATDAGPGGWPLF